RVVAHHQCARQLALDQPPPQPGVHAGLLAEREDAAELDTGRPRRPGLAQLSRSALAAGDPERQSQAGHLRVVRGVPGAVDGVAGLVQAQRSARWGAVTARAVALDDESVRPALLVAV